MEYILMHRGVPTAVIALDGISREIRRVLEVIDVAHLPLATSSRRGGADRAALNDWWLGRMVPEGREGVTEGLKALGAGSTRQLAAEAMGLSLSDQYWIKPLSLIHI